MDGIRVAPTSSPGTGGNRVETENNYWLRKAAGRINRRGFIGGAVALGTGAAGLGIVGCGGGNGSGKLAVDATSTPAPTPAATQAARPGGTFLSGATGSISGVDPHNSVYNGAGIVPVVYNYLLREQAVMDAAVAKGVTYDLAASHKREADGITYTFNLRNNVKIQPNKYGIAERPLDSDDVKASFDRMADKKSAAGAFGFFNRWVDKYDAPDKQTVRLVMKKPYAWTEAVLGNNLYGAIVPKEWLADPNLKKDAVGASGFMVKQLTEGQVAQVDKNPNYYRTGRPYVDSWAMKQFADYTTWRTAFQAGQLDIYTPVNHDESNELKNADKTLVQYSDPSLDFDSFWMNVTQKPWDDPRARRAVNMAMNRKEYVDIIGHGVGEPIGPLTYAFKQALSPADLAKAQPFDVTGAKALFQQAGVTAFKFQHPTSSNVVDYVNIFVRQLQAAGVTATPEPQDAGTWVAGYFQGKLSASLSLNQQYMYPDHAMQWYHTGGIFGNNTYNTGQSDPELDDAIDKAAAIFDDAGQVKAYQDLQKLVLSKDPAMIHIFGQRTERLVKPYVKNYVAGLGSLWYTTLPDLWLDKA